MRLLLPLTLGLLPVLASGQDLLVTQPDGQILGGDAILGGLSPLAAVPGPVGDAVLAGGSLWVGREDGEVWEVQLDGSAALAFTVTGGATVLAVDGLSLLATGGDGFVRRVQRSTGQVLEVFAAPMDVTTLFKSLPAGRLAGTASGDLLREVAGTYQPLVGLGQEVPVGLLDSGGLLYVVMADGTLQQRTLGGALLQAFELGVQVKGMDEHLTDLLLALEDGRLLRVDRDTGTVQAEHSGSGAVQGLAVEDELWLGYAYCYGNDCPCGNVDEENGCLNSTGLGGYLLGSGSVSVTADDLTLVLTHMPSNSFHVLLMGQDWNEVHLGDGLLCIDLAGGTFRFPVSQSSGAGFDVLGPGLVDYTHQTFGEAGRIDAGEMWHFQAWYRDPHGPCGSGFNVTNAYSVLFGL